MNSLLLSRLTKDFLNLDEEFVSLSQKYRIGWSGSVVAPHREAMKKKALHLIGMKKRFANLFGDKDEGAVFLSTSPKLPKPLDLPEREYAPPQSFSRGAIEQDRIRNPEPIQQLLIETDEKATARPVPANSGLIRSLCKGKGVLRKSKTGLIYLDIDNRFINMMLPFLEQQGLIRPPYFNLFTSPNGAHTPVIPMREAAFHYIENVGGLGREFSFEIEGLYSMKPTTWPEVEEVWFFKLKSAELEDFRRRLFLPAHPGGHDFHIAVAVKERLGSTDVIESQPFMRVNFAMTEAC